MRSTRLDQQIAFLSEIDRLKSVERRTSLVDRSDAIYTGALQNSLWFGLTPPSGSSASTTAVRRP